MEPFTETEDVRNMLSALRSLWTPPHTHDDQQDDVRAQWDLLLSRASTPQERDEINDVFSRAVAA